jgi:NADPH:quinone reductase-like Zn-dependent oxidoreductase
LELAGQTLVVIGGSSGIGLETARRARQAGAAVIVTARSADPVHRAGLELGASIAAFDATDPERLERFFDGVPAPIDHVLVAVPNIIQQVARNAASKIRAGGTLLFVGCADDRPAAGLTNILALEIAPVRVNLIVAGSVDAADIAALAVHVMTNTAVTGATYEIDGGRQLVRA